ncbi:MAG: nicotinamide riboside transporter PnuC [Gammaproteobacteria bacterium]|nr:nicotinamide riboside transporter PnuC [Gammaproteobacteria bacterium]
MLEILVRQLLDNSVLELTAVAFAIAYLLLAVREHIACWYMALMSTAIYLVIFVDVRLYMEAALQIFYIAMAVYGWYQWRFGGDRRGRPISTWNAWQHLIAIAVIAASTAISTLALTAWTDAHWPLLDSFTTWSAVVTTFMVARKVLENWVYWFVIDTASIVLYLDRELYFTSMLFAIYLVIILFGFTTWLKRYRAQHAIA